MTSTPDPLREALDYALARDAGGGYVRSTESLAVDVLRGLEVQGFTIAPIAALAQPAPALDFITWELAARFWIHYRCEMVGCEIVEQHEHGGQPMREMTADEIAAALAEPQP